MSDQIYIDLNNAIHDRVIELLRGEVRDRALDVGAGDGTLSRRLRSAGFRVSAVDAVTRDFRAEDVEITAGNLNQGIPFPEGTFGVAVSTEVIEHLENPWFFIRELHRVVMPGGAVVLSTPNLGNIYVRAYFGLTGRLSNFLDSAYRNIGHITPVPLWSLERMVEGLFDIESVTVNASPVPKTRWRLPSRSLLLGQCIVVRLRRQGGAPRVEGRLWRDSRVVREA